MHLYVRMCFGVASLILLLPHFLLDLCTVCLLQLKWFHDFSKPQILKIETSNKNGIEEKTQHTRALGQAKEAKKIDEHLEWLCICILSISKTAQIQMLYDSSRSTIYIIFMLVVCYLVRVYATLLNAQRPYIFSLLFFFSKQTCPQCGMPLNESEAKYDKRYR